MPSLTIRIPEHAAAALRDLAEVECRSPRDQAAYLVLEGIRAAAPITAGRRTGRTRRERAATPGPITPAVEA